VVGDGDLVEYTCQGYAADHTKTACPGARLLFAVFLMGPSRSRRGGQRGRRGCAGLHAGVPATGPANHEARGLGCSLAASPLSHEDQAGVECDARFDQPWPTADGPAAEESKVASPLGPPLTPYCSWAACTTTCACCPTRPSWTKPC
jgi:hypothetical protein